MTATLWIGGSMHTAHMLREAGADAIHDGEITPERVKGRHCIIAPSGVKRDQDAAAERDARRALRLGAQSASIIPCRSLNGASDVADWLEQKNGQAVDLSVLANKAQPIQESSSEKTKAPPSPVVDVDGAELLHAVHDFLGRFVAYPSEDARIAHTLWLAHTHLMEAWESTPRIAFLSPEPGSGKTRALEISETLVPRPVEAINATPAYLFRKVSDPDGPPTILYDEIDTLFGPRAKDNEEIRGILNAGHRRGAMAGRCVVRGKIIETEELPAYCAVALAGLGNLPDTLLSRSVIVRMRRRAPTEAIEPYRRRLHAPEGNLLRDQLAAWAIQIGDSLKDARPDMPAGIEDRDADVWESLLAIADSAGGVWPARSRVSAVSLVSLARVATPSLGIRLLADLRQVFGDSDAMGTESILLELCKLDESPWSDLRGKPLDARRLANYLRQYGVQSKQIRVGERTVKGYRLEDLYDPWSRYLPVSEHEHTDVHSSRGKREVDPGVGDPAMECETSETSETSATAESGEAL